MTILDKELMRMTKKDLILKILNLQEELDRMSDLYYATHGELSDVKKDYSEALDLADELGEIKNLLNLYKIEDQRESMGCSYAREAKCEILEKLVDYAD